MRMSFLLTFIMKNYIVRLFKISQKGVAMKQHFSCFQALKISGTKCAKIHSILCLGAFFVSLNAADSVAGGGAL